MTSMIDHPDICLPVAPDNFEGPFPSILYVLFAVDLCRSCLNINIWYFGSDKSDLLRQIIT